MSSLLRTVRLTIDSSLACCASLGFMDALHNLRHQGHSTHYWNMWMRTFRLLCDTWVDVLSEIEELPFKLRDKYLVFAFFRMEWQRYTEGDPDGDGGSSDGDGGSGGRLQTVGHWDAIPVPLNRLVPTRVTDRLAVAASGDLNEADNNAVAAESEEDHGTAEAAAGEEETQQEDEAQDEELDADADADAAEHDAAEAAPMNPEEEGGGQPDGNGADDAPPPEAAVVAASPVRRPKRLAAAKKKKRIISKQWAAQEHARLIQRLESTPGIGGFSEAKAWKKQRELGAAALDVRPCPPL